MQVNLITYEAQENIAVKIGKKLGKGSNSYIYEVLIPDNSGEKLVGKCSRNNKNYVSFNLQYRAFSASSSLCDEKIVVPRVFLYGQAKDIGAVLIMQKIENIYEPDFIINNSLYYGELIIMKIAEAIAKLHNIGISGYDTEFYWKADTNQLVILDIGPQYTFNNGYEDMLSKHIEIEKQNTMGKWNIISQLIPQQEAKRWFNFIDDYDMGNLIQYIRPDSVNLHVANVARIHALNIISKLVSEQQNNYLKLFIKEYKKHITSLTFNSALYLKNFSDTITKKSISAEVSLYYSNVEPLCKESCSVLLAR